MRIKWLSWILLVFLELYYITNIGIYGNTFKELGCHILLSPETNKEIMDQGINHSIDESCLSAKIYMGHIYAIINQVDYILC